MAVVSTPAVATTNRLSQAELLKRIDPKGNLADIAEVLNESNEIIQDVVLKEGNLETGDQQTIRTGLPEIYWRQMNRGVPSSHSTTAVITETCGLMSARSEIDKKVVELNGLTASFRKDEEKPFIEAMGQGLAKTLFYGDARKVSEGFTGFATRYSTTDRTVADCAKNVIDCGGVGGQGKKLTSIYIVGWGDNVYCPYPKGSKTGLQAMDMGLQYVEDDKGYKFPAYVTDYEWHVGLMVRDWRYVVRLANIDPDELMNGTGMGSGNIKTGNNILTKIEMALGLIPSAGNTQLRMYMNGDVQAGLNAVSTRTNIQVITYQNATQQYGKPSSWSNFLGVPLRRVDQISNNETKVA